MEVEMEVRDADKKTEQNRHFPLISLCFNVYLKRSALMNNPVKNCRRYDNDNILHKILQDKKEREVCPHHSPPVIPDFPLFLLSKTSITVHLSCTYISPPIPNSSIADSSVGASVSLTSITNSER